MALMSTAQVIAFQSANSGLLAIKSANVSAVVVGILTALAMIWVSWVCISSYQALRKPGTTTLDVSGNVVRAIFVLIVILALVTF